MIPSLEHVIKKRHHNRHRLRFLALALVVVGMVFVAMGVTWTLLEDREWSSLTNWAVIAAGFVLPAVPLWLLDERIGRALVPLPRRECPGCRYNLTALLRPVCPECGLVLPAGLLVADRAGEEPCSEARKRTNGPPLDVRGHRSTVCSQEEGALSALD
jgi:hypothetical protein